jgi:hypothetical protein
LKQAAQLQLLSGDIKTHTAASFHPPNCSSRLLTAAKLRAYISPSLLAQWLHKLLLPPAAAAAATSLSVNVALSIEQIDGK